MKNIRSVVLLGMMFCLCAKSLGYRGVENNKPVQSSSETISTKLLTAKRLAASGKTNLAIKLFLDVARECEAALDHEVAVRAAIRSAELSLECKMDLVAARTALRLANRLKDSDRLTKRTKMAHQFIWSQYLSYVGKEEESRQAILRSLSLAEEIGVRSEISLIELHLKWFNRADLKELESPKALLNSVRLEAGENSPAYMSAMSLTAKIFQHQLEFKEAAELLLSMKEKYLASGNAVSLEFSEVLADLATIAYSSNNLDSAWELCWYARQIRMKLFAKDSLPMANLDIIEGRIRTKGKDYKGALNRFRSADTILKKYLPAESTHRCVVASLLGHCFVKLFSISDAKEQLQWLRTNAANENADLVRELAAAVDGIEDQLPE
jgi:hypothetical protein